MALIDKNNRVTALHLCAPNHWAAADKLGKDFMTVHKAVPGFASYNSSHHRMLSGLVHKGPYVRFAWGLCTDNDLNQHPHASSGHAGKPRPGREFTSDSDLYMRIERQCMWGQPEIGAFLFTIRTYFMKVDNANMTDSEIYALKSAISGMDRETRIYKYLRNCLQSGKISQ